MDTQNEGAYTIYPDFHSRLFTRGHYLFYTYARTVSKHAVAIALTRRAIYKIYFGIYLLTSFRKPGQFTQRLNRQVTIFIRLIISIDPTGAPSV